ncbi:MAG: helix-hairpin-helix domain-containing protein [Clostridiales bacterium]|nr:helix-hairpin-helix domain-containing protein [Clostridiales bacterium]
MKTIKAKPALGYASLALCLGVVLLLIGLVIAEQTNQAKPVTLTLNPQLAPASTGPDHSSKINLNTATLDELMHMPGIGQYLAEQIIAQRAHHPFYFIEDLMVISGIGEKRIKALAEVAYVAPIDGSDENHTDHLSD